jgi:hypothetical protein
MRDWLLVIAPIGAIVYFVMHPDQFKAFIDWFARLIQ